MIFGFPKNLVSAIICPHDQSPVAILEIALGDELAINRGQLRCPQCQAIYQIENGILNLLSGQSAMDQVMHAEIGARDKEAAIYDQKLSTRYYKEIPSTLKVIGPCQDKKIIEYGCGTGRLTIEIAPKCSQLLAIDFSQESLLILAKKLAGQQNIGLVLADSTQVKTAHQYFDTALSFQFLEHVIDKDRRAIWLSRVCDTLKNNGQFISTVYHYDLRRRIKKEIQEGRHSSGIFFHYFLAREIKTEFKKYFKIKKIHPIDITLPLESRLKLPAHIAGQLSRISEQIPFINQLGHLLIIYARK